MDNVEKYYVPSIEEFHVGFEYESFNCQDWFFHEADEGWVKAHLTPVLRECSLLTIGWAIDKGYIRVKHLDKSDIESFEGITIDQNLATDNPNEWNISHNGGSIGVFIDDEFDGANVELFNTNFQIKNKSELKRILKQIGI